ncbi:MAG TPA: RICIN domain-containing protein, partial [Polyangia bacterium]|nr:RICIN domain-containing protein [Polyangia bacterium]
VIRLNAGQWYDIKFEYGQIGGGGTAQLSWASSTMAKAIIPTSHLRPYPVSGGILRQNAFSGAASQKFVISDAGDGFFKICAKDSGKCLEIESARKDDAAQVRLFDYRGAPQQMWAITSVGGGDLSVVNRNSAKSIKSTWDSRLGSAIIQQWPYIGYDAEIFTITATP